MPDYKDRNELKELARRIAAALAPDWNLKEDNEDSWSNPIIEGQDGGAIFIHLDKGRLSISGKYPTGYIPTYGTKRPGITVSAEKDAATIARDIRRRFLPDYLKTYRAARERQLESERDEITRQSNLALLAETMGTEARNGRVYVPGHVPGYGHAEMRQPGDVDFALHSIPFDMALKIAATLKGG